MPSSAPLSPCINVCSLDEQGYCRGCMRTRDEIGAWSRLGPDQQWNVIRATEERRLLRRAAASLRRQQEIEQ